VLRSRFKWIASLTAILATTAIAEDRAQHNSKFLLTNGVKLNYLDWGGRGPTMLFLPGMLDSAHTFDTFAPRFTGRFHVLGLSWRGAGLSDWPPSGYDVDTLVQDLKGFLDTLGIGRVILVGHSMAGHEMTRFAGLHPERVAALIYLDAAYDQSHLREVLAKDPIEHPQPTQKEPPTNALVSADAYIHFLLEQNPNAPGIRGRDLWETEVRQNQIAVRKDGSVSPRNRDAIREQLIHGMEVAVPNYDQIVAPSLAIYVVEDHYVFQLPAGTTDLTKAKAAAFWRDVALPWKRANIDQFKSRVSRASVIELIKCRSSGLHRPSK
jgi:pimeloyl-ACP methyl ester carboxylesterase